MRAIITLFLISSIILLSSCATTSVVLLNESDKYPPTKTVEILRDVPKKPYKIIAQLETRGSVGQSLPELLKSMREEAKLIGANAIIPTKEAREKVQQGVFYNPWLGGYQTIGGGQIPILRGLAIVYTSNAKKFRSKYRQAYNREYSFGIGMNLSPFFLSGFGGSAWFGFKKLRFNFEYFKFDVPSSFFRDNFENGKVDNAFRFGIDYFFLKKLSGIYFPLALETWKNSVGHNYTTSRGVYEMVYFSVGLGYLLKLTEYLYFDSRLSIGASLSTPGEVNVGGYSFLPDKASYSAFIGIGINL